MRITNKMLVSHMTANLYINLRRLDKLNEQLSSGKRFAAPEDDPIGVARSLALNTTVLETEQYSANTADANSWLEATDAALSEVETILVSLRETAVYGANDTLPADSQQALAQKVGQLLDHLVAVANTKHENRYLFAGQQTLSPPYSPDPVTGDLHYAGDTGAILYEIGPGVRLQLNVIGQDIFGEVSGPKGSRGGQGLLRVVTELKDALEDGDTARISDSILRDLETVTSAILQKHSEIGARMNRVEMAANRVSALKVNYQKLQSLNEDADMAEVIMDLKMAENVYRAALASGARIIQPTLVEFLR